MAAGRSDLNDVLPNINVPVAVICGDKDPSSPPAVMKPVADAMTKTDVTMTVIDDCGHFSAYEPRPGGRRVAGTGEASRLSRLRRLSVADHPAYRQDIEKIYKTYIRNMYYVCITNIFRI